MTDAVPSPALAARFDFTIDELVDVGERSLARSEVVGRMRRSAGLGFAVIFAALAFLAVPAPLAQRAALAVLVGVLAWFAYRPLRRRLLAARLREYWRERLQGDGPFPCEVELTPQGVVVRQFSVTATTPWSEVASVAECVGGIEITGRRRALIVVRDRAFATAEARRCFVDYAREALAG